MADKKEEAEDKNLSVEENEKTSTKVFDEEIPVKREKTKEEEEHQEKSSNEKRLGFKIRTLEKRIKQLEDGASYEDRKYYEEDDGDKDDYKEEIARKFSELKSFQDTERRLQAFFVKKPEYKKYEDKIRDKAFDPTLQNISIAFIAQAVAGREVLRDEIEARRLADIEAEKTKTGGSSKRTVASEKDYMSMSKEEFEKELRAIRSKGQ